VHHKINVDTKDGYKREQCDEEKLAHTNCDSGSIFGHVLFLNCSIFSTGPKNKVWPPQSGRAGAAAA
jgi:hypothetical protein